MQRAEQIRQTATAPDQLAAAHQAVYADRTLQTHFTQFDPPKPPDWLEPLVNFIKAISPFLGYVFWGGVIAVACIILYGLFAEIRRRAPSRKSAEAAAPSQPAYKPTAARARALLEEADRLAAEGKYGEAVRVLLHRSIEDFETTLKIDIGPSLTSREIARLERLTQTGRSTFSQLASAVESSLFGGHALSASDFTTCREAYRTFALGASSR